MTRKRKKPHVPSTVEKVLEETAAPEPEPAVPDEAQLRSLALDRLAQALHPELFMALQENLPENDPRWITLFAHAFDEHGTLSPLLALKPASLKPVTFDVGGHKLSALETVHRLTRVFNGFPARQNAWAARISFHVINALGEELCAALGRDGMGEVIGTVEGSVLTAGHLMPTSLEDGPLPLDVPRIKESALVEAPLALCRAWLGAHLQVAFPGEDDEELDRIVTEATTGLEVEMGPAPGFSLQVRAGDRPWLPVTQVLEALKRRLSGGLRVLR